MFLDILEPFLVVLVLSSPFFLVHAFTPKRCLLSKQMMTDLRERYFGPSFELKSHEKVRESSKKKISDLILYIEPSEERLRLFYQGAIIVGLLDLFSGP